MTNGKQRHALRAVYTVQDIVFSVQKRGRVPRNQVNIGYVYSIVGIEYTLQIMASFIYLMVG